MPSERASEAPADASGSDRIAAIDREGLRREWEELPLGEGLRRTLGYFEADRIALISAFGPGTLVVIHALHEAGIRLPVIFIDTLHHFPETLEHVERVRERYDLDLRVHRACASRAEFEARYGPRLWERDLDQYQRITKVEPFREATRSLDGWLTGRRRDQGDLRSELPKVALGEKVVINPLALWDRGQVWRYLLEHEIPYHPLHDQGYASIGDEPLTIPTRAGAGERSGRWPGSERTECGIHLL